MQRKIIHIDMDAFFASIEQRDNPDYKGKPLAVGSAEGRGVVAAASYEARKYGVFSAMPSVTAKRKCPHLIFTPPRFEAYKKVSSQIREIFHQYTDLVEPLSLDEAFLDVTENKRKLPSATLIANEIREKIFEKTELTASAGVSVNKFLAKVASDMNKPNGIFVIKPKEAEAFVEQLSIDKFFGVGKVTARKFHKLGVFNGGDLKKMEQRELIRLFGKSGAYYYNIARAIDRRAVEPNRIRKSIGAEDTFAKDKVGLIELKRELSEIVDIVFARMKRSGASGKTVTVKVKYNDFEQITRSKTYSRFIREKAMILSAANELLEADNLLIKPVRLLGVTVSGLHFDGAQGPFQMELEFDYV